MNKNNTIKDLISLMEENGENKDFIIGWLTSMIDCRADGVSRENFYTLQDEIDSGVRAYKDKAIKTGIIR
jgi:hypothetical protein